jgi:hypothetical protein
LGRVDAYDLTSNSLSLLGSHQGRQGTKGEGQNQAGKSEIRKPKFKRSSKIKIQISKDDFMIPVH